mmetsp:Transcript_42720/g.132350  ORF Transcript_42720/g.132350 Transcript_42720/m.132350 type:complete len:119 (-) Transcript_42720:44-400(-)
MLEAADGIAAHAVGGRLLAPLHTACRLWALSWRFLRDMALGSLLTVWCVASAALPGVARLHALFLFRTTPRKGEAQEAEATEGAEAGEQLGEGGTDELLQNFFHTFAPQVLRPPAESA